jgi:ribose-phosphate pyrophosphokinase
MSNVVIVSPDLGSVSRASAFAAMLDVPLAIVDKRRLKSDCTEVAHFIGEEEEKKAILIDDELSSGVSLVNAARTVLERGAEKVYACVTHPKLAGDAPLRIINSGLAELVVLDTIAVPKEKQSEKTKVLSVAPLFGDAITCIHQGKSIGELFRIYPSEMEQG